MNITKKTNKNNKTLFYGNKQQDCSHYGTTGSEYHITGFNEPHEIIRHGRGFQGKSCRHHTTVHDRGLFPVHAACARMGLSCPGCNSKAHQEALFRYKAYIEQIDYAVNRGLDRNQMERLATLDFVHKGQKLFITGSSGTGKSYLACALGHEACKRGFRTLYANAPKLLGALKVAKIKGVLEAELKKIERCQLLILDDLFLVPLDAKERPILLEIIEDRHERKSIIITSQYPTSNWYDMIGDPTIADAILDRIIHTAHTIELYGESMRKLRSKKNR